MMGFGKASKRRLMMPRGEMRDELVMRRLRCADLEIENARLRGEVARLQGKTPAEVMAEVLRGSDAERQRA